MYNGESTWRGSLGKTCSDKLNKDKGAALLAKFSGVSSRRDAACWSRYPAGIACLSEGTPCLGEGGPKIEARLFPAGPQLHQIATSEGCLATYRGPMQTAKSDYRDALVNAWMIAALYTCWETARV